MLKDALFALWFFLPAGYANMAPVLAAAVPGLRRWQTPLDGGRTFRGKSLLGTHKTWRGLMCGIVVAGLTFWLQQYLARHVTWIEGFVHSWHYTTLPWLTGPALGLGALGGDAVKSFFKRQCNIPSGKRWVPFDQLDYVIGAIFLSLPFVVLPGSIYVWAILLGFGMHVFSTYLGWLFKLKEAPI